MNKLKKAAALTLASAMVLSTAQMALAGSYTVVKVDNLWKISKKFDTTWQKLADINKLANPNLIFPNQVLQVPDKAVATTPVKTPVKTPAPAPTPAPVKTETKAEDAVALTNLSIVTAVQDGKDITFDAATTDYTFNVQSDCYGVKITATAPEGAAL